MKDWHCRTTRVATTARIPMSQPGECRESALYGGEAQTTKMTKRRRPVLGQTRRFGRTQASGQCCQWTPIKSGRGTAARQQLHCTRMHVFHALKAQSARGHDDDTTEQCCQSYLSSCAHTTSTERATDRKSSDRSALHFLRRRRSHLCRQNGAVFHGSRWT